MIGFEHMEANGCHPGEETMDVGILPPRKRLLAELKRRGGKSGQSLSAVDLMCSSTFIDSYVFDKLGIDIKDSNITLDVILEASKSAAKAAAQVAAAAKALAMDKAAVAAKAVAAAKKALELVASFEEEYDQTEDLLVNDKMDKQVPVKLLYKRQKLFHVNDEELARKLHHTMNSSPRIAKNSVKFNQNPGRSIKLKATPVPNKGLVCERDLSSSCVNKVEGECLPSTALCEIEKLDDKAPTISRVLEIKNGKMHSLEKQHSMYEVGRVSNGKKIKFKQKKMLLSLCSSRDSEKVRTQLNSLGTRDPEIKQKEKDSSPLDATLPKECCQPVENIQIRTGGEFVAPNFFVESKMLEPRGPNPAVTAASAMIKVDQ